MTVDERFERLAKMPFRETGAAGSAWFSGVRAIREISSQRQLLKLMIKRDIKARYKDSALGFAWSLARPLTQLAIYYLVIGLFLGAERGIPNFAIYVFTGLTAYGLFSEIVLSSTASIVGNSGVIKKVQLPREIFPLASVGSASFNFAIQMVILIAATILLGVIPLSWELAYFVPSLLILLVYGLALGLILSAANVYLRDTQYLVEVIVLIMLWASPIVYSWQMVRDFLGSGFLLELYTNNPVTLAVLGFQRAFWISGHDAVDYPGELLMRQGIAILIGLVLIVIGQRIFDRLQGNFAQEL